MAASSKDPTDQPSAKRHVWALASCYWLMVLFPAGPILHAEPTAPNISQSPPPKSAGAPVGFVDETSSKSATQATPPVQNLFQSFSPQPTGAPVIFADETLFVLYDKLGPFTPQERAKAIEDRLIQLSQDSQIPLDEIRINDVDHTTILTAGSTMIMAVTDRAAARGHLWLLWR